MSFATVAELVLVVFGLLLLITGAIGMWLEEHAPIRDEDEELDSYYAQFRRLPQ